MKAKVPRDGYVRCETLMPLLGCQIIPIPEMPTRRVLGLLTEDGNLALGVTAEIRAGVIRTVGNRGNGNAEGLVIQRCRANAPRRCHRLR